VTPVAKKRTVQRVPVRQDGDGPLRFPGAPCDLCGKTVITMRGNVVVVLEPEEGKPFWAATHGRCARRRAETAARR
jgi:hypothetical protein